MGANRKITKDGRLFNQKFILRIILQNSTLLELDSWLHLMTDCYRVRPRLWLTWCKWWKQRKKSRGTSLNCLHELLRLHYFNLCKEAIIQTMSFLSFWAKLRWFIEFVNQNLVFQTTWQYLCYIYVQWLDLSDTLVSSVTQFWWFCRFPSKLGMHVVKYRFKLPLKK